MSSQELVVAVVGRDEAGKTSLCAHLARTLSQAPSSSTPPQGSPILTRLPSTPLPGAPFPPHTSLAPLALPPPSGPVSQPHRPPPLYVRNARAALSALWRRLRKWRLRHRPSFSEHVLPAPHRDEELLERSPSARENDGDEAMPTWRIIDTPAIDLGCVARDNLPHVVLYVARLDDSRADRSDRLIMAEMHNVFGSRVWDRTIFVLTHGHALPPQGLSYREFLRGRRDVLWRYLTSVVPPVRRDQSTGGETDATCSADAVDLAGAAPGIRAVDTTDLASEPGRDAHGNVPLDALLRHDERTPSPVSPITSHSGPSTSDSGHASEPAILYDEIPPPTMIVVELSDSCPCDESGMKVLPDGMPWMPELLATIQRRGAAASPVQTGASMDGTCGIYRDPSQRQTVASVARQIVRRGSFLIVFQLLLADFLVRSIRFTDGMLERRDQRIRANRSDVICELSDEEYRSLTTKDIPGDRGPGLEDEDTFFFGANSATDKPAE